MQIPTHRSQIPSFCPDDSKKRPDSHQLATSVQMTWQYCLDAHQCLETSNCSRLHPSGRHGNTIWMPLSVQTAMGFLSKTQIWEDSCNRLEYMDSRPDALIHKACRAFKIQTSGRQSSWSRCSCFIYENCVHQINRPDDRCYGPNAPSLVMEIVCNESATVRTRLNSGKNFNKIWKANRIVVRLDAICLPSGWGQAISSQTLI